jgi:tetratricopeptide (TPR) repeat protein
MKVRCVPYAFVSAAFLAAFATIGSPALANSSPLKLTREAYQALQAGNPDAAIAAYSRAIGSRALESEVMANALLNRALAYQQKSEDEKAIADYTTALALDAMSPTLRATALYNRGLSQQKIGKLPSAIEDFTSALLLNPEFAHAFYSRGNALRDSGQLLFALSDYERAIRYQHPDPIRVHYGEAVTYLALRRPLDARRLLETVLAANPDHAGALEQLAKMNATGDNATTVDTEVDSILTGSIAAISGGTAAQKPSLPRAVDVPGDAPGDVDVAMSPAKRAKKRYLDRLPTLETASYEPETEAAMPAGEKPVVVAEVPAIPQPEEKSVEPAAAALVEDEQLASAEPAAEEPEVEQKATGWMVQIASATSEDAAWSTWSKLQKSKKVLHGLKPVVVRADLGSKGVFYRIRLAGFEDQSGAKTACGKLKSAGVSCFISKG